MTEELKGLVEVLQSLSGDARSAFGWWIAYKVFSSLIGMVMLLGALTIVARLVDRIIVGLNGLERLKELTGTPTDHYRVGDWYKAVGKAVTLLREREKER